MKTTLLTGLFLLCFTAFTFAQKEYKPAYIITNEYDTIYGFVNAKADFEYIDKCLFKKDVTSDPVYYTPADIAGFVIINEKYFVSRNIKTDDKVERKFIEYLLQGVISVYTYSPLKKVRYFVQKDGDEELIELTDIEKEYYINNIKYVSKGKKYISVLSYLMIDAPSLTDNIKNTSLQRKSLIKLSKNYHNLVCSDKECIVYEKTTEKTGFEFGINAGISLANITDEKVAIRLGSDPIDFVTFTDAFSTSVSPALGLYARLYLPYFNKRAYLKYETRVLKHEYKSLYTDWKHNYQYSVDEKTPFSISSIKMFHSLSAGYIFTDFKVKPVIEGGYFFYHSLGAKYTGFERLEESYPKDAKDMVPDKIHGGFLLAGGFTLNVNKDFYINLMAQWNSENQLFKYFDSNEFLLTLSMPVITKR